MRWNDKWKVIDESGEIYPLLDEYGNVHPPLFSDLESFSKSLPTKIAKAKVPGLRQETQYTCMATSLAACLQAWDKPVTEEDVNKMMGASAGRGASWEELLAAAQYFGMRATLTTPSTISQLRNWTDQGIPVIIAWNPEGRPWSHASTVYDVDDENVWVMDSNIPDPTQTTRVVPHSEFYQKWFEKFSEKILIRRPACAIEREITQSGKQVLAKRRDP